MYTSIIDPLFLSLKTLVLVSLLFVFLGTPIAFLLSKKKLPLKWLLDCIVTFPLIFPPIAIGFFLLLLLGKEGFLGKILYQFQISIIFSFKALVIASFVAGLPLMVKPLQSAIESFPLSIKEASFISGKSEIKTFVFVVLPTIKSAFLVALLLASARSLGEVGITLMLGGNIIGKTDTVSLAIYNAVYDGDYDLALILSGILVTISLLFYIILHILKKHAKEKNGLFI